VHDFDKDIPKFTALSYTWGSWENAKTILVNGLQATITSNLHAALTHLRSAERHLVFWIDAVCINQNSKHERSHQVSLMRDIYMVAEDVVAFLGPATPGLDPNDKAGVYLDIASRPYWNRLWIIQEFVLGRHVRLQCGRVRHDWNSFHNGFPEEAQEGGTQMRRLFDLKTRYKAQRQNLDIAEAIQFALSSQASDPRDKVYGVLGLVGIDRRGAAFKADYNLSACQVYQQAAHYISGNKDLPSSSMPTKSTPPKKAPRDYHVPKRCDGQKCGSFNGMLRVLAMGRMR
jgi:hypothetical protein